MASLQPNFDAIPTEIKRLIISFAIGGPISHLDLTAGRQRKYLQVIVDEETTTSLLLVSKDTKSAVEAVFTNFKVPGRSWYIGAPNLVHLFKSYGFDDGWRRHVTKIIMDFEIVNNWERCVDLLANLKLFPVLQTVTVVLVFRDYWYVPTGSKSAVEAMRDLFGEWRFKGIPSLKKFIDGSFPYTARVLLEYEKDYQTLFRGEAKSPGSASESPSLDVHYEELSFGAEAWSDAFLECIGDSKNEDQMTA